MAIHRNEIGKRNTLLGMRIQMYFKSLRKESRHPHSGCVGRTIKERKLKKRGQVQKWHLASPIFMSERSFQHERKSNPMPMMYKTIPAVAELNKVPGFDPLKFLRHKVSRKTNEEMLQLELPLSRNCGSVCATPRAA